MFSLYIIWLEIGKQTNPIILLIGDDRKCNTNVSVVGLLFGVRNDRSVILGSNFW